MRERFKVVVDRAKWGRGGTGGMLLTSSGKFCCLGFACQQILGADEAELLHRSMPYALQTPKMLKNHPLLGVWAGWAASVNDDACLGDDQRERKLIAMFDKAGIDLTFEGTDD